MVDPEDYKYETYEECESSGKHFSSCDEDGYCNLCGYQLDDDVAEYY